MLGPDRGMGRGIPTDGDTVLPPSPSRGLGAFKALSYLSAGRKPTVHGSGLLNDPAHASPRSGIGDCILSLADFGGQIYAP